MLQTTTCSFKQGIHDSIEMGIELLGGAAVRMLLRSLEFDDVLEK